MKIIFPIIFIFVLLFFQVGILPNLAIFSAFPNLILLSILSLCILKEPRQIIGWIIFGGLFLDIYSLYNFLGISIISLFLAGLIAYFLSQNVFKKSTKSSVLTVFLISIFFYNIFLAFLSEVAGTGFYFEFLNFATNIFYNLVLSLPVFGLIKKLC